MPITVCNDNSTNTHDVWKKRLRTLEALVKECQEEFKKVMKPVSLKRPRKSPSDTLSGEVKWDNVKREIGGHVTTLGMVNTVQNITSQGAVTNNNAALDGGTRLQNVVTTCEEGNRTMSLGNDPSHSSLPAGMPLTAMKTQQHTHCIVTMESEDGKPGNHLDGNTCLVQEPERSDMKEGSNEEATTTFADKLKDNKAIMTATGTEGRNSLPDNVGLSGKSIGSGDGESSSHIDDDGSVEVSCKFHCVFYFLRSVSVVHFTGYSVPLYFFYFMFSISDPGATHMLIKEIRGLNDNKLVRKLSENILGLIMFFPFPGE